MKILFKFYFYTLIILSLICCAKRSTPTGGAKDSIPPVLTNAFPKLNTTFFDEKEIKLIFDEYVQLNDIKKQLIISPPLKNGGYKIYPSSGASKKLTLSLIDTLLESTTYTFNFGEGIADYNEGNKMSYFTYTFSTGAEIDSLGFKGNVEDAIEMDSERFISLQLYPIDSSHSDSTIYIKKPFYVTSTLDSTIFEFKNLRAGKYELIAIKDFSSNYLFDQNVDKIGFLDKTITLPGDSIVKIKLFKEVSTFSWARPYFINDHHIGHGYYGDYNDQSFELISDVPESFKYLITKNREKDSLDYWFKDVKLDSLKFQYTVNDTLKNEVVKFKNPILDSLVINQVTIGDIDLKGEAFQLSSNLPIVLVDSTFVKIINKDSLTVPSKIKIGSNYDRIEIDFEILPNDKYELQLLPNAIIDFWGNTNDTLAYRVSTKTIEDYGNIYIKLINENKEPFILELLKDNKVIRSFNEPIKNYEYPFELLIPGKYYVRIIMDKNKNKKWDTGNYLEKTQPEEVIYYPFEMELRANWDLKETFNPNKNYRDLLKTGTSSDSLEVN
jgi:uncharacterized protein (DUF2141 family)